MGLFFLSSCEEPVAITVEAGYIDPQSFTMTPELAFQKGKTFCLLAGDRTENTAEGSVSVTDLYTTDDFENWKIERIGQFSIITHAQRGDVLALATGVYGNEETENFHFELKLMNLNGEVIARCPTGSVAYPQFMTDSTLYAYHPSEDEIRFYTFVDGKLTRSFDHETLFLPDSLYQVEQTANYIYMSERYSGGERKSSIVDVRTDSRRSFEMEGYYSVLAVDAEKDWMYIRRNSTLYLYSMETLQELKAWNLAVDEQSMPFQTVQSVPHGLLLTGNPQTASSAYFILDIEKEELGIGRIPGRQRGLYFPYAPTGNAEEGWRVVMMAEICNFYQERGIWNLAPAESESPEGLE